MGATTYIASTLAKRGIALIGVEVFGHGYGPASLIQLGYRLAPPVFVSSPGRTIPVDGVISILPKAAVLFFLDRSRLATASVKQRSTCLLL